jgi:hypothetical protein
MIRAYARRRARRMAASMAADLAAFLNNSGFEAPLRERETCQALDAALEIEHCLRPRMIDGVLAQYRKTQSSLELYYMTFIVSSPPSRDPDRRDIPAFTRALAASRRIAIALTCAVAPAGTVCLLAGACSLLPAAERARYAEEFLEELWEIRAAGQPCRSQLLCGAHQLISALRLRGQPPARAEPMPR